MRDKIIKIRADFERRYKERSVEIICSLLALLAGEHVLFLGPPGTAKSLMSRNVCELVDGNYFYYLLTRFTTPDEVFGPLSLKALQQDDFLRKIDGYLPTAHVAFLDEIFKANSSILNSFLTILNERKFHNGQHVIDVPLISVFGASNEMPPEDNLEALYDRFLFRCIVHPVQDESNFRDMLFEAPVTDASAIRISVDQIRQIQRQASSLKIDSDVQRIILCARREFSGRGIVVSDRRWKKMIDALKVAAVASGRPSLERPMVMIIQHMSWDRPEQRDIVRTLLTDLVISGGESLEKLSNDVNDLFKLIMRSVDRPFPYSVRCYDCDESIRSSGEFSSHIHVHPDHKYYDPCRTSVSPCYLTYQELVAVLEDWYGWGPIEISYGQIDAYIEEYRSFRRRFDRVKISISEDQDRFEKAIKENVWISSKDVHDLYSRYDSRLLLLDKVGLKLDSIESMIRQTGA